MGSNDNSPQEIMNRTLMGSAHLESDRSIPISQAARPLAARS